MYTNAFTDEVNSKRLTSQQVNEIMTKLSFKNGNLVMQSPDVVEVIATIKFILQSLPYSAVETRFKQFDNMQQLLFSPLDDLETNQARVIDLYYEQKKLEIEDKRNQQFDVEIVGDKCRDPKCGSTNTRRYTIQTRSADEPLKTIDKCRACNREWS
jgi:DNA-directed RNA polymerase subunit M/transcription elongation factor TFIIS